MSRMKSKGLLWKYLENK